MKPMGNNNQYIDTGYRTNNRICSLYLNGGLKFESRLLALILWRNKTKEQDDVKLWNKFVNLHWCEKCKDVFEKKIID